MAGADRTSNRPSGLAVPPLAFRLGAPLHHLAFLSLTHQLHYLASKMLFRPTQ